MAQDEYKRSNDDTLITRGVEFLPWEGAKYRNEGLTVNGKRLSILIIGESHYDPGRSDIQPRAVGNQLTRHVVLRQMELDARSEQYWRKLEDAFAHKGPARQFWERVAFYNFVQRLMRDRKERPIKQDKKRALAALGFVLEALDPQAVLVASRTVWSWIDSQHSERLTQTVDAEVPSRHQKVWSECREIWNLRSNSGKVVPAIHIVHPMYPGGFDPLEWRPLVCRFLEWVAKRK